VKTENFFFLPVIFCSGRHCSFAIIISSANLFASTLTTIFRARVSLIIFSTMFFQARTFIRVANQRFHVRFMMVVNWNACIVMVTVTTWPPMKFHQMLWSAAKKKSSYFLKLARVHGVSI